MQSMGAIGFVPILFFFFISFRLDFVGLYCIIYM